jgi:DNA polymerase-3 subunit delta'
MSTPALQPLPWHAPRFEQMIHGGAALPHALLLYGAEGIGKLPFAMALAQALLCETPVSGAACGNCPACGWMASGAHPDLRVVEPAAYAEPQDEEQPPAKASARILIEQIRDLGEFINVASHRGRAKVIVIHPAEALNPNAANALLKSLEEPPTGTCFLLVSHRIHFLLPTIRSRCRHVALPAPDAEPAMAWLSGQGVSDPALALAHTGNAPLLAAALAQKDYWQQRDAFLHHMAGRRFDSLAAAERASDYSLRDVLGWLQKWTFDLVFAKTLGQVRYNPDRAKEIAALAPGLDPMSMLRYHRELLKLQPVIEHPLNARLLLEQLLLDYEAALKGDAV